jgi:hypothetical protein
VPATGLHSRVLTGCLEMAQPALRVLLGRRGASFGVHIFFRRIGVRRRGGGTDMRAIRRRDRTGGMSLLLHGERFRTRTVAAVQGSPFLDRIGRSAAISI